MKKVVVSLLVLFGSLGSGLGAFAQRADIAQEREESSLGRQKASYVSPAYQLSQKVSIRGGYETNPRLTGERKGDAFQELIYSLIYGKRLGSNTRFFAVYALDAINYSEFSDLSHGLNYLDLGLDHKLPFFDIGGGYNAGLLLYPKNDLDFVLHTGYVYIGKKITPNTYHRLKFEYGKKDYLDRSSLGDTISTYQEKERLDRRLGAEYALRAKLGSKTDLRLRTKFIRNDSNARFEDFYDFKAYRQSIGLKYRAFDSVSLYSNLSYRRKEYDSRTVTSGAKKQRDDLYAGSFGLSKDIGKNTAITLEYTYRENSSNDSLADYSESVFTCGWDITF
jgi:hypothetical protein